MGITIDEAIKELEIINHDGFIVTRYSEFEALGLGIEALKVIKEFRTGRYKTINSPLPGETEE